MPFIRVESMKLSFCYGNNDLVPIRLASTWVLHRLRHPHLETKFKC